MHHKCFNEGKCTLSSSPRLSRDGQEKHLESILKSPKNLNDKAKMKKSFKENVDAMKKYKKK